jgi:hypothetical protein
LERLVFVDEVKSRTKVGGGSAKSLCFTADGRKQLNDEWASLSDIERFGFQMGADDINASVRAPAALEGPACPHAIADAPSTELAVCAEPNQSIVLASSGATAHPTTTQ